MMKISPIYRCRHCGEFVMDAYFAAGGEMRVDALPVQFRRDKNGDTFVFALRTAKGVRGVAAPQLDGEYDGIGYRLHCLQCEETAAEEKARVEKRRAIRAARKTCAEARA